MIPCLIYCCQYLVWYNTDKYCLYSTLLIVINLSITNLTTECDTDDGHNLSAELSAQPLFVRQNLSHAQIFSRIADKPWAMWLDSCQSEHVDSRFDILAFDPHLTLTTLSEHTTVTNCSTNEQQVLTDDPLMILAQANSQTFNSIDISQITQNYPDLPFSGGAVGYFGYDLGRAFERLPTIAQQDISAPDMAVGIYTKAVVFDRVTDKYLLICPTAERASITSAIQSLLDEPQEIAPFSLQSPWQSNMTEVQYTEKFSKVQAYLQSGDSYQINLAQRFKADYTGNEMAAYLTLREANKAPFSAFIRTNENAVLSISPERFFKLNQDKVQTKPIKGTRPRSLDKTTDLALAEELSVSTKDRAENLMIVDLLRNDISRVCVSGSVKVPHLFAIESFPAVHHLVSTVEGQLKAEFNATDLLRAGFPGGSITGAPKIRAMEIIEELEPHRRSVYCGSIGYISACGKMDSSITIRTLICEKNSIYCWAGGGLVADSNVESEYQETFDKVGKILPLLS